MRDTEQGPALDAGGRGPGDADAWLELRIVSGGRAGETLRLAGPRITVGRDPSATLQLHPETDLAVSARHAELERVGSRWWIRDLGSRNGTWVDGARLPGELPIRDGSRIRLGEGGPQLLVLAGAGTGGAAGDETPTDRFRALGERNRRLRLILAGASLVVAVGVVMAWGAWDRRADTFEAEREALLARMDSVLAASRATVRSLQGDREGLARTLRETESRVEELRAALRSARSRADGDELTELRQQLQTATAALTRQQLAASLDVDRIQELNRDAVALVYVELAPGRVSTATGFGIRADGTVATNRHVVTGDGGRAPSRIGVQFTGSPQVWPARIVSTAPDADLAILKIDNIAGASPVVAGLNPRADTVSAGAPVALMGFPLGGDPSFGEGGERLPRPLVTVGVVRGRTDGRVELQGYGDEGASGSPVFDGRGEVVAVLFGGRGGGPDRTLLGVPVERLRALLGEG